MAILQFQISPIDPRVTDLNVYRKDPGETTFTRIVQLPVQSSYTDPDAVFGSIYYYTYFDDVRFVESAPSPLIIYSDALDAVSITGFVAGIDANPLSRDPQYGDTAFGGLLIVDISLQNDNTQMPIFDGQLLTALKQSVTVGSDGIFVFSAVPNDLIYPSGSYYKIQIAGKRFFKTISSTNGSSQLFTNLLDVQPFELR